MDEIQEYVDVEGLTTTFVQWLPQFLVGLLIIAAFVLGSYLIRKPLTAALKRSGVAEALIHLLINKLFHYTLLIFGLVMAFDQMGVNVTAALAGVGVAGIAVGFAAQDTLTNIIAGITIFVDQPFRVGDWIKTGDMYGKVSEITLRTTRIRTNRNTWVVIPNHVLIDSTLENHSKKGGMRVDVPVGIAYKEDIDRAREALLEAVRDLPDQWRDLAPEVAVVGLGNSSVDLEVRVWIENPGRMRATEATMVELSKKALDAAGIEIPFPHLQLFLEDVKDPAVEQLAQIKALPAQDDTD